MGETSTPESTGMRALLTAAAAVVWWACVCGATAQDRGPETIWIGGNIYTMDPVRPRAEALAVEGGRIVAVGEEAQIRALAGEGTVVEDLSGATVLPGLIDAHGHMAGLGLFGLGRLDLSGAASYEQMIERVAAYAKTRPKGEWILGGRWDHESWPDGALPHHRALSEAVPDHPVWLRRVDGHAGLANAAALAAAGIRRDTPAPLGGEILLDQGGEPTGVLIDNAMIMVERRIDAPTPDAASVFAKAQEICLSVGLTGVHDMGLTPADVEAYRGLAERGELKVRIYGVISGPHAMRYFSEHEPIVGERLTVRAAKLYADGAMGSRGAWLLAPYTDRPTADGEPYHGLVVTDPEQIRGVALHALDRGYQVCTHAIGDQANRETLNAYERALADIPKEDHRFRIEHAQLLHSDDIPRFAQLGVIASVQPSHCTSDMRWVGERIGPERTAGAYAWRSLLDAGARLAGGSDFPVESPNPFLGIYAAVTRQTVEGEPEDGWHAEQRLTREEALRLFTLDAAYAAFEEKEKGSLEPGKLADFIVIDRDVMACDPAEIPGTRVLRTVIGGETVYAEERGVGNGE